ncbi:MAG: biotin--[acetyl-CoA-carboxylase] ligase [Lachnospiraceae bacterium]|nr:biotin--[acetyl-CoA-carboxylase] ligase [Lachnospiraceae bacterium]
MMKNMIPDRERKQKLEARLTGCEFGSKVLAFVTVDSTNLVLKRELERLPHGTLAIAEEQTFGRGRRGRSWQSPAGTGVWMSLLIKNLPKTDKAPMITIVAALAVARALREISDADCLIKWPNDIVLGGRKICGILTEMCTTENGQMGIIVGIGINISQCEFPAELAQTATSLKIETGCEFDRLEIVGRIMCHFEDLYRQFLQGGDLQNLQEEYNQLLVNAGKEIQIISEHDPFRGIGIGIDAQGRLLVESGGTVKAVLSGEVSVRGIYGYC